MTYYDLLEIKPDASPEIVRAAYKAQAKKYHPDSQNTGDTEYMKKINEAYEVLSDPERRAAYDRDLKEGRTGTGQEGQTANNNDGQSQAPSEAASQQPAPKKKRLGWYLSWPILFIVTLINIPVGIALTGWRCLKVVLRKDMYKRKRRAIGTALYLVALITFIYPIAKNMSESDGTVNTPPAQSSIQSSTNDTPKNEQSNPPTENITKPDDTISTPSQSTGKTDISIPSSEEQPKDTPVGPADNAVATEPSKPITSIPEIKPPKQDNGHSVKVSQERLCNVRIYVYYNGAVVFKPGITVYLDDRELGKLDKSGMIAGSSATYYTVATVGEHTVKVVDNNGDEAEQKMTVLEEDFDAQWNFEYIRPKLSATVSPAGIKNGDYGDAHRTVCIPYAIEENTNAYDEQIAKVAASIPEFYDDLQMISGSGFAPRDYNYGIMFWYFFKDPSWHHGENGTEVVFSGYAKRKGVDVPVEMTFLWQDDVPIPELGDGFTRSWFTLTQATVDGNTLNYQQKQEMLRSINDYYFTADVQHDPVDNEAKELNY